MARSKNTVKTPELPFDEAPAPEVERVSNLASDDINKEVIFFESSNLPDFITGILKYLSEGYELDYEHNDTYPVHFGYFFKIGLVKAKVKQVEKV